MDLDKLFIKDMNEYNDNLKLISNVFRIELELPEQVFLENYDGFLFEEFDWTLNGEFWNVLQILARSTNDNYIITAVMEPSPVNYFYNEFGYFNWGKLPINLTSDKYLEFIESSPKDSEADSILYNSNIIIWTSPSMKWGIFGDRNYGVCIIAFKSGLDIGGLSSILKSWKTVEKALELLVPNNFVNQKVPKEIYDSLCDKYFSGNNNTKSD